MGRLFDRTVLLGNPENRRVALFQAALHEAGLAPAQVIAYQDILNQRVDLVQALSQATLCRFESPGENPEVERLLFEWGGVENSRAIRFERGRIWHSAAWYRGFCRLLEYIEYARRDVPCFNSPQAIALMFNKPVFKRHLGEYTPPELPQPDSYDRLIELAARHPRPRFFLKLNYSSSASGVLAFEYNQKTGQAQARTTIEIENRDGQPCFFNSLKICKYTRHSDLRLIIDFLLKEGAYLEPWLTKSKHGDSVFDLRVLAIAGKRQHCIARLSRSPLTNLHLGNQRCNVDELALNTSVWQGIDELVATTMARLPGSLYAGLDVLLPRAGGAPVLLEANAFGDLLPGLFHHGHSTYAAQITALQAQFVSTNF